MPVIGLAESSGVNMGIASPLYAYVWFDLIRRFFTLLAPVLIVATLVYVRGWFGMHQGSLEAVRLSFAKNPR